MKLTKKQFKILVENYLLEQAAPDATSSEAEASAAPEEINFKVNTSRGDVDITLKKEANKSNHSIYIDEEKSQNIDSNMDSQIIAAHGYIHPKTDAETKEILAKILNRDPDFKGKNESGIRATIDDKMSSKLGAQSLGLDQLENVLDKG